MRFANAALAAFLLHHSPIAPPTPSAAFSSAPKFSSSKRRRGAVDVATCRGDGSGGSEGNAVDVDDGLAGPWIDDGAAALKSNRGEGLKLGSEEVTPHRVSKTDDDGGLNEEGNDRLGSFAASVLGAASAQIHVAKVRLFGSGRTE